ncbi:MULTISPECIES: hypothetical protein, partial [unclassified Akkermansia]|uniref:hypothetical protein n=1 Tax=unclassified Akkermansia TaxID=2608915 RepID=UPI00195CF392
MSFRISHVGSDGFGSGFGCRSDGFHQLLGRVVCVAGCDAIFVGFSQGPAAHPFCGTGSAIGLRSFDKFELGVVLVVFGRNQRPIFTCVDILFHPCGGAVLSNVLNTPGTLTGNNAPLCLNSGGHLVESTMIRGGFIGIDGLNAVDTLAHLLSS